MEIQLKIWVFLLLHSILKNWLEIILSILTQIPFLHPEVTYIVVNPLLFHLKLWQITSLQASLTWYWLRPIPLFSLIITNHPIALEISLGTASIPEWDHADLTILITNHSYNYATRYVQHIIILIQLIKYAEPATNHASVAPSPISPIDVIYAQTKIIEFSMALAASANWVISKKIFENAVLSVLLAITNALPVTSPIQTIV